MCYEGGEGNVFVKHHKGEYCLVLEISGGGEGFGRGTHYI